MKSKLLFIFAFISIGIKMRAQVRYNCFNGLIVYADNDSLPQQIYFFPITDTNQIQKSGGSIEGFLANSPVGHLIYFQGLRYLYPGLEEAVKESEYRRVACVSSTKEFTGYGRYMFAKLCFKDPSSDDILKELIGFPATFEFKFNKITIRKKIISTEENFHLLKAFQQIPFPK